MLDEGPVNVYRGTKLIARRARVIWEDGRLYIARSSTAVRNYPAPEPVTEGKGWKAGDFTFTHEGCRTCGWGLRGLSRKALQLIAERID